MYTFADKTNATQLLILDVDGVMTSGTIYYNESGDEAKGFHIHDGLGIKLLQKAGINVAVISGKQSNAVARRLTDLNIKHFYLGHEDKTAAYQELKSIYKVSDNHIAYMGDDLPDLPLLQQAGFAITVPQAPTIIKEHADYITTCQGGQGAVREIAELILKSQDKYLTMIQSYLIK